MSSSLFPVHQLSRKDIRSLGTNVQAAIEAESNRHTFRISTSPRRFRPRRGTRLEHLRDAAVA